MAKFIEHEDGTNSNLQFALHEYTGALTWWDGIPFFTMRVKNGGDQAIEITMDIDQWSALTQLVLVDKKTPLLELTRMVDTGEWSVFNIKDTVQE